VQGAAEPDIIPRDAGATMARDDCRRAATKALSSNARLRAFWMAWCLRRCFTETSMARANAAVS